MKQRVVVPVEVVDERLVRGGGTPHQQLAPLKVGESVVSRVEQQHRLSQSGRVRRGALAPPEAVLGVARS